MKRPNFKLGTPLTVATVAYIILSLFGSLFYLVFPDFLCSIGARIHTYTLILHAMQKDTTVGAVVWMVISHLYVLVMLISGVLAIVKGRLPLYTLLTGLEIVFTVLFLLFQESGEFTSTYGILANVIYWLWLCRRAVPSRRPVRKKHLSMKGK